ncbi:fimbrial protein [Enterobacter roggenkampii]|uniref:fimbrial protein n=1 Tax=Enterobacter roggenkampii TaxID=1812935 RepID=UPI002DB9A0FC|nr:fimbrial protein [Enterobacter roggenkampii]MEB6186380.1 type 1 fimbrial protein [Enterobacter roggenkampii]
MKKYVCFFALLISGNCIASNNLEFFGKLTESTCDVGVSGSESNTVNLPRIINSQLPDINSTAGLTPFLLMAKNCNVASGYTLVAAFFNANNFDGDDVNNVDSATGYLNNLASTSPASDVKLRIGDGVGHYIKVGSAYQVNDNKYKPFQYTGPSGGNMAYIPYIVEYIKTADTGHDVGAVRGVVTYDLMYK